MKKIFFIIILFLNFSISHSINLESLTDATEDIQEVQEDLKNLSKADNDIAKSIDSAVEQLNKATEFVNKSLKENNVDSAIKTLEFIEKSLGDVVNIVPQELTSDMSKVDMSQFDKDKLDTVMSITKNMNKNKEQNLNELVSNMIEMQRKGLDVQEITSNLKDLGIDTIEISVQQEKFNEMSKWSKEQWADSYDGSVIINIGNEVIVDKEIDNKILELENKFSQNNSKLLVTRNDIKGLKDELIPINSQMVSLSEKKKNLVDQYNAELLKQDLPGITEEEIANSKAISDTLAVEITNLSGQLNEFKNQSDKITNNIISLNNDLQVLDVETSEIAGQITKLNDDLQNIIDIKADLAISEAKKADIKIEEEIIGSIAKLDNISIIKIEGTNTFRIVDTDFLTDKSGKFKLPKGTMTVNGNIFSAGALQPEKLLSFEKMNLTGGYKVSYSKAAMEQINSTGKIVGGTQNFSGSSLGSWVLVDVSTGKQMRNPFTGHQGSIVCEASTCGPNGSFGKQAAKFGGMYVIENLANPKTGNVAGMCSGGNCEFNFGQNVVSTDVAKANIEAAREITEINSDVAKNVITNSSELASNVIDKLSEVASRGQNSNRLQQTIQEINKSQAAAAQMIAYSTGTTMTNSLSSQTAMDALAGQITRDMVQGATNEFNSTSEQLREAQQAVSTATAQVAQAASQLASATTDASRAAAEAAQAAAQAAQAAAQEQASAVEAAQAAAQEALQAAQQATQDIQQAARDAQQAAGDVVAGISGNDMAALSQLANDALGVWQEVDAQGRAVNDQQIVCTASQCGSGGHFGQAAASRGNSYTRTNRTGGY